MKEELQRWYAIKIFERDKRVIEKLNIEKGVLEHIENDILYVEKLFDDDAESIITNERYNYVTNILRGVYRRKSEGELTTSDKIDRVVTNRWAALPIFALVMFVVYFISVTTIGTLLTDFINDTLFGAWIIPALNSGLEAINCWEWLQSLVVDGIVSGVGSVLSFVPQMLVLFFLLAFLEACGYMARIAFVMDKIFRKFGLSGKSFIPLLIGTGCSVPGIMASRTIENERDRRMTIITTSFIPCGAKLPVIALISGVMFGRENAFVATGAFFIGMAAVVISGLMLKKTKLFAGDPAPFVMELPAYHMPTLSNLLRSTWERGWSFIKKAGTVILVSTVVLWFLQGFGFEGGSFGAVESAENSLLAFIGKPFAFLLIPLGIGIWQAAVATITGLIAKENIVATFGILYGIAEVAENGSEIWGLMMADFTPLMAFTLLVFNLLCAPCFAAIGAIKREMNDARWTWFAIGYQTLFAYAVSLVIYQIGALFSAADKTFVGPLGPILAFLTLAAFVFMMVRPEKKRIK